MTLPITIAGNPNCTLCKLHRGVEEVCEMGFGPPKAKIMVVGKMPNSGSYQRTLETYLEQVGIDPREVYFTAALKCRNFDSNASALDVKTCRAYLEVEITKCKPTHILALGNEALQSLTGHSGITKYRGRVLSYGSAVVVPTISPSAVTRNPGQMPGFLADLRLFGNQVAGRTQEIKDPNYFVVDNHTKLKKLRSILENCQLLVFDVETHSEEWRPDGRIISVSGTCLIRSQGKLKLFVFALPLYHPESPFRKTWRAVLRFLDPVISKIKKVVAHNGKYDEKWFLRFGCGIRVTFDTLLAIHLLNENVQKGLKPQAAARLGVAPWGVDTRDLLNMPLDEVLHYNVLDTYYDYLIYLQLREELLEQPRLLRIFMKIMMPANEDLVHSEMRGIWIDVDRLHNRKPIAQKKLDDIHDKLGEYLPDPDFFEWPTDARGRKSTINYNASNFARWFLFTWLALPIVKRGKEKADGSPGDPSMAEDVLLELKDKHPAVQLMLDRVEWQKILTGFFNAYEEIYDEDHRIHTNFKLAGTVTGRLSSGKTDEDKISGVRGKIRGVNLQQVPRNPLVRGLFGVAAGWSFVEADYSQIELRIAAYIARERNMLHLYAIGADLHRATAARVTLLPESAITPKVRKEVGKPVNFGFLYGMGPNKFISTAFNNYGSVFSYEEAVAARRAYFDLFPDLLAWHARQRRLVAQFGRVQSPIGRIRHLPDIYSPDAGVRAEAERQAINSPVQGFASDLAVLSMIEVNQRFRDRGIAAHCLGLVHDAINYEIRDDHLRQALPIIQDTMEDMRIVQRKFGVHIDVPILSDLKIGRHWGDTRELTRDEVQDWAA